MAFELKNLGKLKDTSKKTEDAMKAFVDKYRDISAKNSANSEADQAKLSALEAEKSKLVAAKATLEADNSKLVKAKTDLENIRDSLEEDNSALATELSSAQMDAKLGACLARCTDLGFQSLGSEKGDNATLTDVKDTLNPCYVTCRETYTLVSDNTQDDASE